jgi:gas vesicle protein
MSKKPQNPETNSLDSGMLIFGVLFGFVVGGIGALFAAPRSGRATRRQITGQISETGQTLRTKIETAVPADPVATGLAEGKAAARRRRTELGLDS